MERVGDLEQQLAPVETRMGGFTPADCHTARSIPVAPGPLFFQQRVPSEKPGRMVGSLPVRCTTTAVVRKMSPLPGSE